MTTVYIGLGSNLGDRLGSLQAAVRALAARGVEPLAVSSVYESDAVGPPQPEYLNAVVSVTTTLAPAALLAVLKEVESELGRHHAERWGPREIDLDLLLYGDEMLEEEGLTVPHPEMTKRSFVLLPLLEIAPDLDLPSGEPATAFLERDPPGIRKLGPLGPPGAG